MIIKSISLTNFRNHDTYHLDCNDDTTLILGKNGCGKTSVLEAIYILTRGKSFRATDQDIVKRKTDFYRIELITETGEKNTVTYDGKTKTFTIMDKKSRRLPKDHKYPVVLFLPSDLNLISGSPSRHREYFDRLFAQLDEKYSSYLSRYEKALRQRNEILKSDHPDSSSLFSWNLLLAKYGSYIYETRKNLVDKINSTLEKTYFQVANKKDKLTLNYQTEISQKNEDSYLKNLEKSLEKDLYLKHTSFGVHRDDFIFYFNDKPADGSASRGETRSIILALKFIEASMMLEYLNQKPLVLLDDVFSELDDTRRQALIKNFKHHQIILTSVEEITLHD